MVNNIGSNMGFGNKPTFKAVNKEDLNKPLTLEDAKKPQAKTSTESMAATDIRLNKKEGGNAALIAGGIGATALATTVALGHFKKLGPMQNTYEKVAKNVNEFFTQRLGNFCKGKGFKLNGANGTNETNQAKNQITDNISINI